MSAEPQRSTVCGRFLWWYLVELTHTFRFPNTACVFYCASTWPKYNATGEKGLHNHSIISGCRSSSGAIHGSPRSRPLIFFINFIDDFPRRVRPKSPSIISLHLLYFIHFTFPVVTHSTIPSFALIDKQPCFSLLCSCVYSSACSTQAVRLIHLTSPTFSGRCTKAMVNTTSLTHGKHGVNQPHTANTSDYS